jgi:hypothetical protein
MHSVRHGLIALAAFLAPATGALATQPKLDATTCAQLRVEENKVRQTGILRTINKGAEWAKANLTPDQLSEVQHYLTLDEQVQFGCRDSKLSAAAKKASEAASRIEINSDADPTAPKAATSPTAAAVPPVADPPKPAKPAATAKSTTKKRSTHKKAKPVAPETQNLDRVTQPNKVSDAAVSGVGEAPTSAVADGAAPDVTQAGAFAADSPILGFGETQVIGPVSR